MRHSRRTFVSRLGAGLAAVPVLLRAAEPPARRYPIAFSTLGCPGWPWAKVLEQATALGYAAIELRGVGGEMDLPRLPEFAPSRLAETRREVASRGLVISDLGASARMHEKERAAREAQLDEGRRFIDLAQALGVRYVRMFGDKVPEGETKDEVLKRVVAGFQDMAAYAAKTGVTVLIESHGDFTRSADLVHILQAVGSPHFQLLWDAHHTFVAGGEAPADTFAALGPWVRHTHLKDSRPRDGGRRYVLTGTGEVPVRDQVKVLARAGYPGFYAFEWEKKWHPEIEEPEVALPHFARVMAEYLAAAGVKPL